MIIVPLRGRARTVGALVLCYTQSHRHYDEDDLHFAEELADRAGLVIERWQFEKERGELLERERVARAQAEHANRAKDEFLATVSHELRNPLTTIVGWARILGASDLPEKLREPINAIERNATAQQRLIEDMLDVSRIISGKLRLELGPTHVTQVLHDAVEAQQPAALAKSVRLVTDVDTALEAVADSVRLQQIVTNLVSNAVKFTPPGGEVRVAGKVRDDQIDICVSDTGEGIEPGRLSAIFQPFKQEDASTTRRHGGLGLGLAIVCALVTAHGGSVHAESEGKGKGAKFVVHIPFRVASVPARAPTPASTSLDNVRVLVVDDEPDVLELVTAVLSSAGARTEGALSADEAVTKVRTLHPDVIVSDIGMPGVDGYELMRRVRASPPKEGGDTPAIALTAYTRPADEERARAAGFQMHVSKPVEPVELIAAVANTRKVVDHH